MGELSAEGVRDLERALGAGEVAIIPTDTVYGLACAAQDAGALERLYALKGRSADKPAAVLFTGVDAALGALPELGPRTRRAFAALLPGPVTLLVDDPEGRFALAGRGGTGTVGVRVPALEGVLAPLGSLTRPVAQSSANHSGGPDAAELAEVPADIRRGCAVELDAGPLPGTPSTVLDLRGLEATGDYEVLREGALPIEFVREALARA